MNIKKLLAEMTVDEKAALVSGTDFMHTNPIPRLGIPGICMADGPHGLRKQIGEQDNGISQSEPATAFPTAVTTASSWNPENTKKMGAAIARECRHYDVNILLGPGVNIKRNPLCGRNFEYFSEDPLLAGKMGIAEVQGIQQEGVAVSVKHFALNNSENFRFMGDSIADKRTIREIYLKPFEMIVKEAMPKTMMCAYNKINGTYCSENEWLLTDVLRNEWQFDGTVMTDWGAMHDRVASLKAGLDLEMPGDTKICRKWILDGIQNGTLEMGTLDKACENILKLIAWCTEEKERVSVDWEVHHHLAAELAADSAVLLKNDDILPLRKDKKYLVIGELFEKMRYQGAGSSMIHATKVTSAKNAFDESNISYEYVQGYRENQTEPQQELIRETMKRANEFDTILVFVGLTDYVESEGCDREKMQLPENQLALMKELGNTGKDIVVILFGGSVIELPFEKEVKGILNMFLPGQNGGTAVKELLFGEKTPCGRLSETWPCVYEDVPFGEEYSKEIREIYKESVYVGYRYYLTAEKEVRYPFGYGLSYTTFAYEDLEVIHKEGKFEVSCNVVNIGNKDGAEVVQLYVKAPKTEVFKPEKELRGFSKVYLRSGEKKKVTITLMEDDLKYYDIVKEQWILEEGEYEFLICSDCQTVKLAKSLVLAGEKMESPYLKAVLDVYKKAYIEKASDELFEEMSGIKIPALPPRFPVTLESRFTDLQQTFMGRVLYGAVLSVAEKQLKEANALPEGPEKDNKLKGAQFLRRILESNSLCSMSMSSGTSMPYNFAEGFVEFTNGHLLRGAKYFLTGIKVPPLPKDK